MRKTCLSLLSATMLTFVAVDSFAANDVQRLEQRLMMLEQKMFSGSKLDGGTLVVGENPNKANMLADFEVRLQQLEEEAQKVYGAVEKLGNSVDEFAKKMDLINKDYDMRLQDLEAASDETADALENITKEASQLRKDVAAGKLAAASDKGAEKKVAKSKKSAQSNPDIPKDISAEDLYNKAYNFLVATSYDDAEAWMKEFLVRHESHKLADNAYYWLGEIYLVQDEPQKAVVNFTTGLSKFPEGAKAPANLLKMGVAFKRLGKEKYAKSSWKKLVHDFKDSPEAEKAAKELASLK